MIVLYCHMLMSALWDLFLHCLTQIDNLKKKCLVETKNNNKIKN